MTTVTITSQGQITIPAAVRKAWGLRGSEKLHVTYDAEQSTLTLEKPLTVDEATRRLRQLSRGQKKVPPLTDIHEFYERERTKEIVERMKDWS